MSSSLRRKRRKPALHRKTTFRNGLTVVTERTPGFRSLSIGIWVKAGTRHEKPREQGISHFLEHMLFKGTDKRSALDLVREVEEAGGEFNAFTAREYTCFHVLTLDRDIDRGIDILTDVLLNSTFDPVEMERERKVILQEIAMVGESPEEMAHDIHMELVYGKHGLGRDILGTETSVRRLRRGDLLRYFRKHYRPDQLIVSVAGDVAHDSVVKKLSRLGKHDWPGRPRKRVSRRELGFEPAPKPKAGFWWIPWNTEQVHLIWGVAGPRYSSRDRFAVFLLNVHLGGGMSSALFQEIREKRGMAYTVYSSYSPFSDSGVFTVYAATNLKQVPLCLKLIEETEAKLRKELLSEHDLQMVKDNLKGTILLSNDNVESRMTSIARHEIFFGKNHTVEEICAEIDAVTPQDIRRVARKLFASDRSILALGPKPSRAIRKYLKPVIPKKFARRG